jgi:glycerophosphoryl diester phosphodiesterase
VRPLVIAHRGASGERPEHTLGAYARAISQGADFIEPDLVMTRDGVLVCRHENEISATTDVASRSYFASRRSVKLIDGVSVEGWFTEDFTLDELKSLRCRERLPALRPANTAFDGQETIATFDEVCDLVAGEGIRLGRTIGVYPETKHPSYFESIGLSFDDPLIAALRRRRLDVAMAPCFIQSFETQNLKRLALSVRTPLVQLVGEAGGPVDAAHTGASYRAMVEDRGLEEIAGYAAGIGPAKGLILPRDPDGRSLAASDLVRRAHRFGLKVHAWTFRSENFFLPRELRRGDPAAPDHMRQKGDAAAELRAFFAMGVDGVFADFPAEAVAARA